MTMCLDLWEYHHGVRLGFSRPGKPTDNGPIETFNGSLRDECPHVHWFDSLEQARALIELLPVPTNRWYSKTAGRSGGLAEIGLRQDHGEGCAGGASEARRDRVAGGRL